MVSSAILVLIAQIYQGRSSTLSANFATIRRSLNLVRGWLSGRPRSKTFPLYHRHELICIDTISTYTVHLKDLEQIIVRMVFCSLGVEKYYESLMESTEYGVRLSELGVPLDQETKVALKRHLDPNLVTIVCQHLFEGLEVQTREGEWIHVVPLLNSFTVNIGEAFLAWTNGRLQSPWHRVRMTSNEKRYSVIFDSRPKDGYIIQAPKELVDEEHPLLYKPYIYEDYQKLRFSEKGARAENPLKDFCGIGGEEADL